MNSETEYLALARRLSKALLSIRPLGGSEMFIKVGNEYFADPEYCERLITEVRQDLHEARKEVVRLQRRLL